MHNLKHTFGRRLRAAGVPRETRTALLGHWDGNITAHYSAAEIEELIEGANAPLKTKTGSNPGLTLIKITCGNECCDRQKFGSEIKRKKTATEQPGNRLFLLLKNGAPGRIRTSDRLVRSQVLYPTELRARKNDD